MTGNEEAARSAQNDSSQAGRAIPATGAIPIEPVSRAAPGAPVVARVKGAVTASVIATSVPETTIPSHPAAAAAEPTPVGADALAQMTTGEGGPKIDPAALVARGNEFLALSDVTSARLLFKRAADGGSAAGALAMAATYDPLEIDRLKLRGIRADAGIALEWYRKAAALGESASVARTERLMAFLRREAARGDAGAQALLREFPQQ